LRISDERYARDMRRYDLARRMIEHEARTTTITAWTGLTRYRVQNLFRQDGLGANTRHRGLSPFQPRFFVRSAEIECESAALAAIELQMQIIETTGAKWLPTLAVGERLVAAFEMYCSLVPSPRISLEHAFLLAKELTLGTSLKLNRCTACRGLMIVDVFAPFHERCAFCRRSPASPVRSQLND